VHRSTTDTWEKVSSALPSFSSVANAGHQLFLVVCRTIDYQVTLPTLLSSTLQDFYQTKASYVNA